MPGVGFEPAATAVFFFTRSYQFIKKELNKRHDTACGETSLRTARSCEQTSEEKLGANCKRQCQKAEAVANNTKALKHEASCNELPEGTSQSSEMLIDRRSAGAKNRLSESRVSWKFGARKR